MSYAGAIDHCVSVANKSKWLPGVPLWKRLAWQLRAELLKVEFRVRRIPWQ